MTGKADGNDGSGPVGHVLTSDQKLLLKTSEALNVAMLSLDYLTGQVEALITLSSALLRTHPEAMKFAELLKLAQDRMVDSGTDQTVLGGHEKAVYWLLDDDGPLASWRKEVGLPDGEQRLEKKTS